MKRKISLLTCIMFFITACAQKPDTTMSIVPETCNLNTGEEFPISLQGSNMPASGKFSWEATKGEIDPPTGLNAIYTAPNEPGTAIITALLEASDTSFSATLVCEITATIPTEVNTPVIPNLPIPTATSSAIPAGTPSGDLTTIAITEVMAAPCDGIAGPNKNEYVELYNYGDTDIDVNGWRIAAGEGGFGTPDEISAWDDVNTGISLGINVITDNSVISPRGYAVVLSPRYHIGTGRNIMPYIFPKGTIILTLKNNNYLGNDSTGLLGNSMPYSVLALYVGSETVMDTIISTYGTPTHGSSPQNVFDNTSDNFPFLVKDCHSMERIAASEADLASNWRELTLGTPGADNYP